MQPARTPFPESYEASRIEFQAALDQFRQIWPEARLVSHRLQASEDLTIDWIGTDALEEKRRLLVLSSGEHGVEAYVGSAIVQLFIQEFLHRLDPEGTGVLVFHAINPWGMKHRRRVNQANVDLNRNFVLDPNDFDASFNPDYERLDPLLNPLGPVQGVSRSTCSMLWRLARRLPSLGTRRIETAVLVGQYRQPKGIYYGGDGFQEETRVVTGLLRDSLAAYGQIVHLDMHSGWGPRYQMSLVTSRLEPRDSEELQQTYSYPAIVKATADEFYTIRGDMIDYAYTLVRDEFHDKRFFAASFEFGTLGDSTLASLRGLRTEILENQMHWYGASSERVRQRVMSDYMELNAPPQERWRAKALDDARQAFEGVLGAEGYLAPAPS